MDPKQDQPPESVGPRRSLGLLSDAAAAQTFLDPVCGMTVAPERAAGSAVYNGQTYYFCNPRCLEKFQANPQRYVAGPPASSGAVNVSHETLPATKVEYICPMDPEVVSD